MGTFKKGLFVGGLLGAALMWLNTTKKGKETREQILDNAAVVYSQVIEKARQSDALTEMTKNKYVKLVKEAVDKYAEENEMAEYLKNMITKVVSAQWKNVKNEK
jgi:gas vesicle protein